MERRNIGPLFEESTSYNKTGIPWYIFYTYQMNNLKQISYKL